MPKYHVTGEFTRTINFDFEIDADSETDAQDEAFILACEQMDANEADPSSLEVTTIKVIAP